jgi:hypothetical protein
MENKTKQKKKKTNVILGNFLKTKQSDEPQQQ